MTTEEHLANVIEWGIGNRGTKSCNPYSIPEIKSALKHLAKLQGISDHLDVDTRKLSGWTCSSCKQGQYHCEGCQSAYCLYCNKEICPRCNHKW